MLPAPIRLDGNRLRQPIRRGCYAAMVRLLRVLLLGGLLAGCAASSPQGDASCCAAPDPGTARLHLGGQLSVGVGFSR
jgi:hypothetical protein